MTDSVPVIVNALAGSGRAEKSFDQLADALRAAAVDARILLAKNGGEVVRLAKRCVAENHPVIVAAGGDGTVSGVAGAMVDSRSALGVVPLGTFNHFAKDAGIPLAIDAAARAIAANGSRSIDVAEVNGRVFLNNSSIGLYPTLVLRRREQQRRLGRSKWHASFWAAMTALEHHPTFGLEFRLDGKSTARRTSLVFIGNNRYVMDGFHIRRRERLDEGRLSIYITTRRSRGALIGLALRALLGRLRQARDFEALTATHVAIAARRPRLWVATDGEVSLMQTPLDYRIRPAALRLIVPR